MTDHTTPKTLAAELKGTKIGRSVLTHLYLHTLDYEVGMVRVLADACRYPEEMGMTSRLLISEWLRYLSNI
ncbi:MAG: hypothetical protein KAT74_09845 [Candidatus Cloacimonetes bacterium]|nr:hypothetical protein [Candidatus Cloacimonadota bacterium]